MVRNHFISLLLLFILTEPLLAHKPIWSELSAVDANSAIPLIDPNISQVVYRSLPPGPNQICFVLSGDTLLINCEDKQ